MDWVNDHNASNAVIVGRVGAYCGSVFLEEGQCWISDNAILAKSRLSEREFFDYAVLKHLNLFEHHVGTGQQLLTQTILSSIPVPEVDYTTIEQINDKLQPIFRMMRLHASEITRLEKAQLALLSDLGH